MDFLRTTNLFRSPRFSSWIGSAVLHIILLLAFLFLFKGGTRYNSVPSERTVRAGIVLKSEVEHGEIYTDGNNNAFNSEGVKVAVSVEEMLEHTFATDKLETPRNAIGVDALSGDVGSVASLNISNGFAGAGDKGTGVGGGSYSTVTFYGEGTGNRFVFVIDMSGSMSENGGRPFLAAKRQLISAIDSLKDTNEFNIIFYNDTDLQLFSSPQRSTDANKAAAKRFINARIPGGGTKHSQPLYKAIAMKPDVVFFLTDGDAHSDLRPADVESLTRYNGRSKTSAQINTIRFGDNEDGGGFMRKLSAENDGQYRFVNVRTFE
ncbi:MAG: VWA domain-containing protein [Planctomycetaceae bacterium]|jgi:hypothetical protein|nr:VWA domain-containing protein [Planctomycetaceae bacterium]